VRPGFTCTADITTATRKDVVAVPIPAVAVRELIYDANGQIIREPRPDKRRKTPEPVAAAAELKPGQTRKETEGVFVVRSGKAEFLPIKMGIAGEKYFEVLSGLKSGDEVITGPYNSVRGMTDGDVVKVDNKTVKKYAGGAGRAGRAGRARGAGEDIEQRALFLPALPAPPAPPADIDRL
jgi:HlyD family secretion protein